MKKKFTAYVLCTLLCLTAAWADGNFVGVKKSREVHTRECPWHRASGEDQKVYFSTLEEAKQQGYNPCSHCLPGSSGTGTNPLNFDLQQDKFATYDIIIKSADKLRDTDPGRVDLTDPYIVLYGLQKMPDGKYSLFKIGQTPKIENTTYPKWNYKVSFEPRHPDQMTNRFFLKVIDRDPRMPRDIAIGNAEFRYTADNDSLRVPLYYSALRNYRHIVNVKDDFRQMHSLDIQGAVYISIKRNLPQITVPDFTGHGLKGVVDYIKRTKAFNYTIKTAETMNPEKAGKILSTEPSAGTKTIYGSNIVLYKGTLKKTAVPDVRNMRIPVAVFSLKRAGLKIGETKEQETSNPRSHGKVVAQSIKPGTTVIVPTTVDLELAKYVQPDPVDFPDIIGMNYRDAIGALRDAGLFPAGARQKPFDAEAGTVIETMPDREAQPQLMPGSRVGLVIAAPDQLGVTMAFPIEKAPGQNIKLDFNKNEEYFLKINVKEQGYLRFIPADGSDNLPLGGELFTLDESDIASYSCWDYTYNFRVSPQEYFIKFGLTNKYSISKEESVVEFAYEFVPEMDPGEINDEKESATLIETGRAAKIAIYPENDTDWFLYEPEVDGYLRIVLDNVPDAIDHNFMFRVYEQGTDKDLHAGEYLPTSVKVFAGKKYLVKISVLGVDCSTETFSVTFNLIPEKDETEPNDTIDDAYVIEGSFMGDVFIMGKAEHDYFKLLPEKGANSLTIDIEHNDYMIRPRVHWSKNREGLEDAEYCKPRDKTCTIPVNGEDPIYLYVYNDHTHNYSDDPMIMSIAYQYPEAEVPLTDEEDNAEDKAEAPVQDPDGRARSIDLAKQAYEKLKQGNYDESVSLYKQAIKLYEDKRYWHDMGLAYFRQKDWKNAEECFQKAVEMDISYYLGHKSLGSVLGEMNKYELSIQSFERALAISDEDPMIYYNLARSYEGLYRENNTKVDELKKAFEYSSIARDKIKDDKKVDNQYKRLKNMMNKLDN